MRLPTMDGAGQSHPHPLLAVRPYDLHGCRHRHPTAPAPAGPDPRPATACGVGSAAPVPGGTPASGLRDPSSVAHCAQLNFVGRRRASPLGCPAPRDKPNDTAAAALSPHCRPTRDPSVLPLLPAVAIVG
ncbi:hypothetical protein GCM10018785_11320 [Streptomyces longispororuber]|uniref:Uncharacterized protein n=1 Tax=Streptomyces longispororuber TaxID=68230 RepID=A0A919DFN3_9ACTN|nr:hypothetical protein GCM10018785_11320 [Streptomyces longispororuber]